MKIAAALFAAALLVAGCSGSDDTPKPAPTSPEDISRTFSRAELEAQAKAQAKQVLEAQEDLANSVKNTIFIVFKDGKVTPQGDRIEVKVGQEITLNVTSDVDEELHVHSEPEYEYAVVADKKDQPYTFTVDKPGQVAVEAHELGVTIVQLVVRP